MTRYIFHIPPIYWEVALVNHIPFNCFLEGVLKYRKFKQQHPVNLRQCVYAAVYSYATTELLVDTHQLCKENIWWIADQLEEWLPQTIDPNYIAFYTTILEHDLILCVA